MSDQSQHHHDTHHEEHDGHLTTKSHVQRLFTLELQVKATLALASDQLHAHQLHEAHDIDHHHELVDILEQVHGHLHEAHKLLVHEVNGKDYHPDDESLQLDQQTA